jgi:hypothetical protein
MIGPAAVQALDELVRQALRETCGDARLAAVSVADLAAGDGMDPVLLHISSYQFRLTTLLCLEDSPAFHARLGTLLNSPVPLEGASFADGCGELANRVCGAINRSLARAFHHVGMSTPLSLSRHCLLHLDLLRADHICGYDVRLDADAGFRLVCCLTLTQSGVFDFTFDASEQDAGVGELELF